MYAWATPEYCLNEMSLQQWVKYYKFGWDARKTDAQMFWGVLGEALSSDDTKKTVSIKDFKKIYPDGTQNENGYTVTR